MPQCLFCLREGEGDAVRFTDEHVFPAALGGNLTVKDGSCDGCNHGNSKFEQALAGELTPIRMLLQIPDRYGNVGNDPDERLMRFVHVNLPKLLEGAREKFDAKKGLLDEYVNTDMGYPEFVAKVRGRYVEGQDEEDAEVEDYGQDGAGS